MANARREELAGQAVVAKFATTTQHGAQTGKTQTHMTEYNNLDVIISVWVSYQSNHSVAWSSGNGRMLLKDYILR